MDIPSRYLYVPAGLRHCPSRAPRTSFLPPETGTTIVAFRALISPLTLILVRQSANIQLPPSYAFARFRVTRTFSR